MPLNELAKEMVGDGKSPNAYFITVRDQTVMLILEGNGLDDESAKANAIAIAEQFSDSVPVIVEDRLHGEVWANPAAQFEAEQSESTKLK